MTEIPKPAFRLSRVYTKRDQFRTMLQTHLGAVPDETTLSNWAGQLCRNTKIRRSVVAESLRTLAGKPLQARDVEEAAWRLAGNLPQLEAGNPVYAWTGQSASEWVPGQVKSMVFTRVHGRPCYDVSIQILAGSPCGHSFQKLWSSRFTYVLAKMAGFGRRYTPLAIQHATELVGMRFAFLLSPSPGRDRGPQFDKVDCTSSLKADNKLLIKARRRIGYGCQYGFTHPCFRCNVGTDLCPVAIRTHTTLVGVDDGTPEGETGFGPGEFDDSGGDGEAPCEPDARDAAG